MSFTVIIEDTGEVVVCNAGEAVLKAVARLARCGIPVGCLGGGCGICKIRIQAGTYRLGKMSRKQVTREEEAEGWALACRTFPLGDLRLRLMGTASEEQADEGG